MLISVEFLLMWVGNSYESAPRHVKQQWQGKKPTKRKTSQYRTWQSILSNSHNLDRATTTAEKREQKKVVTSIQMREFACYYGRCSHGKCDATHIRLVIWMFIFVRFQIKAFYRLCRQCHCACYIRCIFCWLRTKYSLNRNKKEARAKERNEMASIWSWLTLAYRFFSSLLVANVWDSIYLVDKWYWKVQLVQSTH